MPYLQLVGTVAGGWQMALSALAATRTDDPDSADASFRRAKLASARFYFDHVLCLAAGLSHTVLHAADSLDDADGVA